VLGQQKSKVIGEIIHAQKIIYKEKGGSVNAFQIKKTNEIFTN